MLTDHHVRSAAVLRAYLEDVLAADTSTDTAHLGDCTCCRRPRAVAPTVQTYTVRFRWHAPVPTTLDVDVLATSPSAAMALVERQGHDYSEAEVCDESGRQLAVFGDRTQGGGR
jgi:hypothetical protein